MRPTAADRVAWSVYLSVYNDREPCKRAEPVEMPFGMWTLVGQRNCVLGGGPDPPPREGTLLRENDVGISLHAVDQRSDWPATERVECKNPVWCGLSSKFFDHLLLLTRAVYGAQPTLSKQNRLDFSPTHFACMVLCIQPSHVGIRLRLSYEFCSLQKFTFFHTYISSVSGILH